MKNTKIFVVLIAIAASLVLVGCSVPLNTEAAGLIVANYYSGYLMSTMIFSNGWLSGGYGYFLVCRQSTTQLVDNTTGEIIVVWVKFDDAGNVVSDDVRIIEKATCQWPKGKS